MGDFDMADQDTHMCWALRDSNAEFGRQATQSIDDLGLLPHQKIARLKDYGGSLLRLALDGESGTVPLAEIGTAHFAR